MTSQSQFKDMTFTEVLSYMKGRYPDMPAEIRRIYASEKTARQLNANRTINYANWKQAYLQAHIEEYPHGYEHSRKMEIVELLYNECIVRYVQQFKERERMWSDAYGLLSELGSEWGLEIDEIVKAVKFPNKLEKQLRGISQAN